MFWLLQNFHLRVAMPLASCCRKPIREQFDKKYSWRKIFVVEKCNEEGGYKLMRIRQESLNKISLFYLCYRQWYFLTKTSTSFWHSKNIYYFLGSWVIDYGQQLRITPVPGLKKHRAMFIPYFVADSDDAHFYLFEFIINFLKWGSQRNQLRWKI